MKAGTKTTEFWVAIAPVLIGLIEGMKGDQEIAKWLIVCGTTLSVCYIASRTYLKAMVCRQDTAEIESEEQE